MAKKTANPADAFRKAQRAKELKKNKEDRKKARDTQTVKRDTRDIEFEIKGLKGKTDAASKTRLTELESELSYIIKTKEAYVAEHPEARDQVFRTRNKPDGEDGGGGPSRSRQGPNGEDLSHLYDENGRLRDPKKSIYYHEMYNPFGVPPPGMPYRERTAEQESEEEDEDEDSDDDDIIMPEGPPPNGESDDSSDDSDVIPLPEGPPPPKSISSQPPLPLPQMPYGGPSGPGFRPMPPRPYFPQPGLAPGLPVRPGFAPPMPMPMPIQPFDQVYGMPSGSGSNFRPRPPRQNVPHNRAPNAVQDPLSDAPTQTYQGYRMTKHELPAKPDSVPSTISASAKDPTSTSAPPLAATISAEPVLRDLRKEATAFVPRGLKKKQATSNVAGIKGINSAPGAGQIDEDGDERKSNVGVGETSGLMGKLQGVLSTSTPAVGQGQGDLNRRQSKARAGGEDDYQNFLAGLGDIA